MTGIQIKVTVDDLAVRAALHRLIRAGGQLRKPLAEAGSVMENRARERFGDEAGPDGAPWADLKPATIKRRRIPDAGKLQQEANLKNSLAYLVSADHVEVGSDQPYAAIHQLGGTSDMAPGPAAVPARPYIGPSRDELADISQIFVDYLAGAIGA